MPLAKARRPRVRTKDAPVRSDRGPPRRLTALTTVVRASTRSSRSKLRACREPSSTGRASLSCREFPLAQSSPERETPTVVGRALQAANAASAKRCRSALRRVMGCRAFRVCRENPVPRPAGSRRSREFRRKTAFNCGRRGRPTERYKTARECASSPREKLRVGGRILQKRHRLFAHYLCDEQRLAPMLCAATPRLVLRFAARDRRRRIQQPS